MTTAKRQTIVDFLKHSICEGQSEVGPIGYSPLPINLVQSGFTQVNKLKLADDGVDFDASIIKDVKNCHNPTFIPGKPAENYLAKIAPFPAECDRPGQGPCADNVGAFNENPDDDGKVPADPDAAAGGKKGDKGDKGGNDNGNGTDSGTGNGAPTVPTADNDGDGVPDAPTGAEPGSGRRPRARRGYDDRRRRRRPRSWPRRSTPTARPDRRAC